MTGYLGYLRMIASAAAVLLCVVSMPVQAQEKAEAGSTESDGVVNDTAVYSNYCANISDVAEEARAKFRKEYLEDLESRVKDRTAALEAKRSELEQWMKRRETFLARATQNLIDIYAAMRAESAALQIAAMNENTAAAILLKLKPRKASSILNEIPPEKAARLASIIAGAAKPAAKKGES